MVKVIEHMGFRATIDFTNKKNAQISIDVSHPIEVREYKDDFSVWYWDDEFVHYFKEICMFVDDAIFEEKMRRRREALCGAS